MKKEKTKKVRRAPDLYDSVRRDEEYAFKPTKRSIWYAVIFVFSLIFTQLLRAKASHIFFLFVLILPFVSVIYLLIARSVLKIYMISESREAKKLEDFEYEFRVLNESVIPYPFVEAVMTLPQKNSVRCRERVVKISMPPSSSYSVKSRIKFRFRGNYEIGVRCFYVYDFLRIFRMRVDIDNTVNITVYPRKLLISDGSAEAVSDEASRIVKAPLTIDKIEVSDIRDYRPGDPLKSIHWKLSSKSEDFIIRDFNTGSANMSFIFCDFSGKYPDEAPDDLLPGFDGGEEKKISRKERKRRINEEKARRAAENAAKARAEASEGDPDIVAISDEALEEKAEATKKKLEFSSRRDRVEKAKKRKEKKKFDIVGEEQQESADKTEEMSDPAEYADILALAEYYEDMNEFCADGVVELAISELLDELSHGNETCLIWYDKRSPIGIYAFTLHNPEDLDLIFKVFSTAPICEADKNIATLSEYVGKNQSAKQIFVTGSASRENISSFCSEAAGDASAFGSSEVVLYSPDERFAHKSEREVYLSSCADQLGKKGIKLSFGRLPKGSEEAIEDHV